MEGYVADHQAHVLGMGGQQLLHVGIHRAAGLAGRVEEFHDRDRRRYRPQGRRAGRREGGRPSGCLRHRLAY